MKKASILISLVCAMLVSPSFSGQLFSALLYENEFGELDSLEDRALDFKSEALYMAAMELYREALRGALRGAQESAKSKEETEKGFLFLARCEVFLGALERLVRQSSAYRKTIPFLQGLVQEELNPLIRDQILFFLGNCLLRLGRLEEGAACTSSLGFLEKWWIIGPFSNERGTGYGKVYPPELEFDPGTRYEGKERRIGWFRLPIQPQRGTINLRALLRPNQQACAYALTHVHSPAQMKVALRVGTGGDTKIWLNGELVLEHKVLRRTGFDQDSVFLNLKKGWNTVLVKLGVTEGEWGFRARVTKPSGGSLPLLSSAFSPEAGEVKVSPAPGMKASDREILPEYPGAISYLTDLLSAEERGTSRLYLHLALLHRGRADLDASSTRVQDLLLQGLKKNSDSLPLKYLLSLVLHKTGKDAPEVEENERRRLLQEIVQEKPDHVEALLQLALYYEEVVGNPHKAAKYVDMALELQPDFLDGIILKANKLARRGMGVEALCLIKGLQEGEASTENNRAFYFIGKMLEGEGRLQEAREAFEKALQFNFSDRLSRQSLVHLLERHGEYEEALRRLREFSALDPCDVRSILHRSWLKEGLDDLQGARGLLTEARSVCPESFEVLFRLGNVLHKMGEEEAAFAAWEHALSVRPGSQSLRRYMDYLKGGEGIEKEEYEEDRTAILEEAREWEEGEEGVILQLLKKTVARTFPDGRTHLFEHRLIRIRNEEGIKRFQRIPIGYVAGEQEVTLELAKVYHPDGREEDGILRRESDASRSYWPGGGISALLLEFPTLEEQDVMELRFRVEDLSPGIFGSYFGPSFSFQETEPVFLSKFTLMVPEDRGYYFHTRGPVGEPVVSSRDGERIYRWEYKEAPGLDAEPYMPGPAQEFFSSVEVSTFKDWNELARWYWGLIQRQGEASEEIRKAANLLSRGKEDRMEKIRSIYDFVTSQIRYQQWEFGIHGYKPYSAATVFARRFGDCKDKSTLINTMLGVLGIKAYPALLRASPVKSREDFTLARFQHFNHCISYIPGEKAEEGLFLDGTAALTPLGKLPGTDYGATALIVYEDRGELMEIPVPPPEDNRRRVHIEITLDDSGGASLIIHYHLEGESAEVHRNLFLLPARRKQILERTLSQRLEGAELRDFNFSNVEDRYAPLDYTVSLWVPTFGKRKKESLSFSPVVLPYEISHLAAPFRRKHDLLLPMPSLKEEIIILHLPEGYSLKDMPADTDLQEAFGEYHLHFKEEENKLTVKKIFQMNVTRIKAEAYPVFRSFVATIDRAEKGEVLLEGAQ